MHGVEQKIGAEAVWLVLRAEFQFVKSLEKIRARVSGERGHAPILAGESSGQAADNGGDQQRKRKITRADFSAAFMLFEIFQQADQGADEPADYAEDDERPGGLPIEHEEPPSFA